MAVKISVLPYVDSLVEFNEVVFLSLAGSSRHAAALLPRAQVAIEDLKPQLASKSLMASPAWPMVRRPRC